MPSPPSVSDIFLAALRLGCTSFGGPVAHLGYFRHEYVEKRRWLDEQHYADLVALGQFLPGPASSQVGFGVGYQLRGLAGGLAAWVGFTLPSALLMIAAGYGVAALGDLQGAGWLRGLKAAAVAVVAQAVYQMWRSLCPDVSRSALAGASAGVLLLVTTAWIQVAIIAAGAVIGLMLPRCGESAAGSAAIPGKTTPAGASGATLLAIFLGLLLALPAIALRFDAPLLEVADRFYRAGALVFGGGHVVLPLLEREVVGPGWLTHDQFLAGYGAAQAVPGPLFTFAAYLGTVMNHGPAHSTGPGLGGVAGGLWALAWVFLPALLLMAGVLPYWSALRQRRPVRAAMQGANAVVVGMLLAALVHPVGAAGITDFRSALLVLAAFAALQFARAPAWAVVGLAAAAGAAFL
jgi:chromate transporter